jgi:hypothetical protein
MTVVITTEFVLIIPPFNLSMSKALASKKTLPSKEAGLFRELLNFYETRQLKKGLKTADQILKKFPEQGGVLRVPLSKPQF